MGAVFFMSATVAPSQATAQIVQREPLKSVHVSNYRLALKLDERQGEIFGDEVVTAKVLVPGLRSFYLNSAELDIDAVELIREDGRRLPLQHVVHANRLWITLRQTLACGMGLKIRISYHGLPRAGLFFVRPSPEYPDAPTEVYSQGEPDFNEHWFPNWDYPNDMATSEIIATVAEGQVVVSNGKLISESHTKGLATFDWVESVPHSSYLTSIAVGPWRKIADAFEGLPIEYYVPPSVDEATARRSFHLTPDMIRFFSSALAVDYPYEKYSQTTVHDFPFGGEENVSATTLTEATLHDDVADNDFPSTSLVSHELGQQWCGDFVQGHDWANIWLNEGCATFLDALYTQYRAGNDEYRYEIYNDQLQEQAEERLGRQHPLVDRHFTDPMQTFDEITHEKGAAVLDMLRFVLDGRQASLQPASVDEPMLRGLHEYLDSNRARSVGTDRLVAAMQTSTGKQLSWFFDEWVRRTGYPDYRVEAAYDANAKEETLIVRQTQDERAFDMPIEVVFHGADGLQKRIWVRDKGRVQTFRIRLAFRPRWVDFDPNDVIDKTLEFQQSEEAMEDAALHDDSMMGRLWAVQQLGMARNEPVRARIDTLTHVLTQDPFYGVRVAAAASLGELNEAHAESALLAAMSQDDSRTRAAIVTALGHYVNDPSVFATLVTELRDDPSYAVRASAAMQIGSARNVDSVVTLVTALDQKPEAHITLALLDGLAATHDDQAVSRLIEESEPGVPKRFRLRALTRLAEMGDCVQPQQLTDVAAKALRDPFFPIQEAGQDLVGAFQLEQFRKEVEREARTAPTKMQRDAATRDLQRLSPLPTGALRGKRRDASDD
jgi:aminopeptidase N